MSAHVLVAGGAGFVGSHLCDALLERGSRVTVVDNLSTGALANLEHLMNYEKFRFIHTDVCDSVALHNATSEHVDEIYHLASPASPDDFDRRPFDILRVGSYGTWNLLDLAVAHSARLLYASTSEVYGDPEIHPQPETYNGNVSTVGPRSCYDEAKRFGEALCAAFVRHRNADVRIARIFNTYGPRMRDEDGRVISNFIVQALNGESLTVYGDGNQTRSFCYVSDLVGGLMQLMGSPFTEPVNVGNPSETSINDLARTIIEVTKSLSSLEHVPLPSGRTGDPRRRCPDVSRLNSVTGWEPRVSLRDGLLMVLHHRHGTGASASRGGS
jgi:nucleoside-diphosphate-sugar epimerase